MKEHVINLLIIVILLTLITGVSAIPLSNGVTNGTGTKVNLTRGNITYYSLDENGKVDMWGTTLLKVNDTLIGPMGIMSNNLLLFSSPNISFSYSYDGVTLKEKITLQSNKNVSYVMVLPPEEKLIPWDHGDYKIVSNITGYTMKGIILTKPTGTDALGRDVPMGFVYTGGTTLSIEYNRTLTIYNATLTAQVNQTDEYNETIPQYDYVDIKYPLVIDPTWQAINGHWIDNTTNATYTIEMWNATGTSNWSAPYGVTSVEYLVVAGGGGGGNYYSSSHTGGGGGGGAGGLLNGSTFNVNNGTIINIMVGSGGAAAPLKMARGGNGTNSTFGNTTSNITAVGGGGGGTDNWSASPVQNGSAGGSGGGASTGDNSIGGGNVSGQGFAGADQSDDTYGGQGGGGAGVPGSGGHSSNGGGSGGAGSQINITETNTYYAGGGGGGGYNSGSLSANFGPGGLGGGGYGGGRWGHNATNVKGENGTNGLGGGGGAGYVESRYGGAGGGSGGSGVVIIKYLNPIPIIPILANFTSNVTNVSAGGTVQFNDTSIGTPSPTGWAWFFGDETYNQSWVQQNASNKWRIRNDFAMVALPNGTLVLMGGYTTTWQKDTWRSTDYGVSWTRVDAGSGWTNRSMMSAVALPNGNIVLMGGANTSTIFNDTWRSTDYGVTWTQMNTSSGWAKRQAFGSVAMPDGSIILAGGSINSSSNTFYNDTWRSTNSGTTWVRQNASGEWRARQNVGLVNINGTLILFGGNSSIGIMNDTWKSVNNGTTWTQVNSSSGWAARQIRSSVAMPDGSIVIIGGYNQTGTVFYNDTWRSTNNGVSWTQINASNAWTTRRGAASVIMSDGSIILAGGANTAGTNLNDTWRFQPAGSSLQNPTHVYSTIGLYNVTLTAYNAYFTNTSLKIAYINVTSSVSLPVVQWVIDHVVVRMPQGIIVNDTSTNTPTSWNWSWGDGTANTTTNNATHQFTKRGAWNVTLTATNAAGSNTSSPVLVRVYGYQND